MALAWLITLPVTGALAVGVFELWRAGVRFGRWFLPEQPDVVELLRRQVAATSEGVDAFAAGRPVTPLAAARARGRAPR